MFVADTGTRRTTPIVLIIATLIGIAAFLYPFILPGLTQGSDDSAAHAGNAPLIFAAVTVVCLAAIMVSLSDDAAGVGKSRTVALLGVLVAIDATLRLVPGFAGASPIFLLIMLVGYVFGPSLGFQMGAMTLLLSAIITGGIGPWLPFQMMASGWLGMSAGWLPQPRDTRYRVALLALFGALWGFLFGVIMNLWFWPFTAPGADASQSLYWQPGLGFLDTVNRYARFYAVTSLAFDALRAMGNVVLLLVLGAPVLRLLERYRARFTWSPWTEEV